MITNDFTLCMLQFYTPLISQKFAGSARGITLPSYIKNRRRLFLLTTLKKIVLQILSKDRSKYSLKLRSGEFKRRVYLNTLLKRRLMARGLRSHPPPPTPRQPLGIGQAFVILSVPEVGNLSANLCPGYVGHMSILLKAVNIVPFSIFQIKICVFEETKSSLASGRWITSSKSRRAVPDPNFEIRWGAVIQTLGEQGWRSGESTRLPPM